MEAENRRLKEELERVHVELEYFKGQKALQIEPKIQGILEKCRE